MDSSLAIAYLLVLLGVLGVAGFFIVRQVLRTRRAESTLKWLQNKLTHEKGSTQEYYELGSLYLSKNLFSPSVKQFQAALKAAEVENETDIAPIYNAMGYAYFSQDQYDLAIRQYKEALKLKPDYISALNNLGHAYERKNLAAQALEAYEATLKSDPKNGIAKRRVTSLRKRVAIPSSAT
jgi:tetratricopeptide (TPR) repeat protein